jgi:hypothetical protein
VAAITEDGISYVVIVRSLNMIKKNNVLEFHGVSYHTVSSYQSRASDESAVTHFGIGSDDAGSA